MSTRVSAKLRKEYPESPWLWREDWSEGRIPNALRSVLWAGWRHFAIACAGAVAIVSWMALRHPGEKWAVVFLTIVGAVVLALMYGAMSTARAGGAMACSVFCLDETPDPLGQWLRGRVELPGSAESREQVSVSVRCVYERPAPEDDHVLWEEKLEPVSGPACVGGKTVIPVEVQLPIGCPETEIEGPHRWEIAVRVDTDRGPSLSRFDIPVFRIEEDEEEPTADSL